MGWDEAARQFCSASLLQRESSQNKFQVPERQNFLQSFTQCFFRPVNSSFEFRGIHATAQGHDERRHVSYTLVSGRHGIGCLAQAREIGERPSTTAADGKRTRLLTKETSLQLISGHQ